MTGTHGAYLAVGDLVAFDLYTGIDGHPVALAHLRKPPYSLSGARIAARLLVQHHLDALMLEVGPNLREKITRVLSDIDIRRIIDAVLASVYALIVGDLVCFAAGDIAHLLETEGHRIVIPNVDGVSQDGMNRLGHIKVTYAAAGDAGCTRSRTGFIQENDVGAFTPACRLELHCEVPRSAQSMHAAAYDEVGGRFR